MIVNITGDAKAMMQYDRYEKLLVVEKGIQLANWPDDVPFVNASEIGSLQTLRRLLKALTLEDETERCRWVHLSEEEWEARKTAYYEAEEEAEPKKRKRKTRARNDTDTSDSEIEEVPAKKNRKKAKGKGQDKENNAPGRVEGTSNGASAKGKGKGKAGGKRTKKKCLSLTRLWGRSIATPSGVT
jgi:hypothetical protein